MRIGRTTGSIFDLADLQRVEVLDVDDAKLIELLGADRRDGDRHLLETLLAALRGDDDLLEPGRPVRLGGGCGRRDWCGRRREAGQRRKAPRPQVTAKRGRES